MDHIISTSFPSLEAAVSALGEKVFGARIVIDPPPVPAQPEPLHYRMLEVGETIQQGDECCCAGNWVIASRKIWGVTITDCGVKEECFRNVGYYRRPVAPSMEAQRDAWAETAAQHLTEIKELKKEVAAWRESSQRKSQDIDELITKGAALEKESERLHALWHKAAADAGEQRAEVERLTNMVKDLSKCNATLVQQTANAEDQCKFHHHAWVGAMQNLKTVTKERNELLARVAELEPKKQVYRMLEKGEIIEAGDEYLTGTDWRKTACVGYPFHINTDGGNHLQHRRPL